MEEVNDQSLSLGQKNDLTMTLNKFTEAIFSLSSWSVRLLKSSTENDMRK